ncbi:MFS transporter [Streptomyces buecherae]|uniref:MFS transporter n=1 Tax=Streptomyces buecherae TaxID=2763006 RepID=UPI00379B101A
MGRSRRSFGQTLRRPFASTARGVRRATHAHGAGESGLGKLIELHAVNSAGDMMITVALASTVFFSVPTDEARGRVALYLAITLAPFALLAPVIGPLLDRIPHGRRAAMASAMLTRALLALTMADVVSGGGLELYPAALGVLVASKAYGVVRSAVVPRLLPPRFSLVKANSRVTLGGLLATGLAAPIGAGLHQLGPAWPLYGACAVFTMGTILCFTLPHKVDSAKGEARAHVIAHPPHLRSHDHGPTRAPHHATRPGQPRGAIAAEATEPAGATATAVVEPTPDTAPAGAPEGTPAGASPTATATEDQPANADAEPATTSATGSTADAGPDAGAAGRADAATETAGATEAGTRDEAGTGAGPAAVTAAASTSTTAGARATTGTSTTGTSTAIAEGGATVDPDPPAAREDVAREDAAREDVAREGAAEGTAGARVTAGAREVVPYAGGAAHADWDEEPIKRPGLRNVGSSVLHAWPANATMRTLSGFLTLFLAFMLREHPLSGLSPELSLGIVAVSAGAGNALGTAIGAGLRARGPELIIVAVLTTSLATAITAAVLYSQVAVAALAAVAGLSQALGKLSLDALIQRDVPENVRTSAFARSETALQMSWVVGGAIGIALPLNGVLGMSTAVCFLALGWLGTVRGLLASARRGTPHPRVA